MVKNVFVDDKNLCEIHMSCTSRFGFRPMPQLVISAKPRVGERQVSLTHITDWIEHKLALEFQVFLHLVNISV